MSFPVLKEHHPEFRVPGNAAPLNMKEQKNWNVKNVYIEQKTLSDQLRWPSI